MGESLSWFSWYCKLWTIFVQLFVLHCMVQSAYLEMESSFNQQSANIKQHKNISTISSRDFTKAQGKAANTPPIVSDHKAKHSVFRNLWKVLQIV